MPLGTNGQNTVGTLEKTYLPLFAGSAIIEKQIISAVPFIIFALAAYTFAVPLSILPSGTNIKEGQDVTDILHIRKFEIDDDLIEENKKSFFEKILYKIFNIKRSKYGKVGFPQWIEKTDQERIQNKKSAIDGTKKWIVSEKLDGTSATYAIKKYKKMFLFDSYEYFICSRNLRISEKDRTSKYIKVMDPIFGIKNLSYKEFEDIFLGTIIILYPINKIPNIKLKLKAKFIW